MRVWRVWSWPIEQGAKFVGRQLALVPQLAVTCGFWEGQAVSDGDGELQSCGKTHKCVKFCFIAEYGTNQLSRGGPIEFIENEKHHVIECWLVVVSSFPTNPQALLEFASRLEPAPLPSASHATSRSRLAN